MRSTRSNRFIALAIACFVAVACATKSSDRPLVGEAVNFAYPIGPAAGALTGAYPNPGVSVSSVSGTLPLANLTPGTNGQALITAGGAATWGAINLGGGATSVTGATPAANGGTGLTTLTTHAVPVGEGTSAVNLASPGAAGTVLVSGGASVDPSFSTISNSSLAAGSYPNITGVGTLASGGTGAGFTVAFGSSTLTGQVPVVNGGTSSSTLTAHAALLGEGTSAVGFAPAGASGTFLRSSSASVDPTFNTIQSGDLPTITLSGDTTATGSGGALTTTTGKINGATVPAAGALTTGNVLQVSGASALTYSPLVLSSSASVSGALGAANGGTGDTSIAAHAVLVGAGTSPVAAVGPGASGLPLVGAGASADPSFAALNLAGAGVTGNLAVANVAPGSNGQVITTTGGATVWGPAPVTASVTGSGVWHSTAGALNAAASVGTAAQALFTNAGGTDTVWSTYSGDVAPTAGTPGKLTAIGLQGSALSSTAPTSGQSLSWSGSQWSPWSPTTGPPNGSWSVGAWYIDPVGGSDTANTGQSSGSPFKTFGHLAGLWGTYSPRFRQDTSVTFLKSQPDDTDPVYLSAYAENGALISLQGALPTASATGTLSAVTAKNRATAQILTVTLTSGLVAGQLIVNTTHNSRAWLYKNTSGNVWQISQPMVPITLPYSGSPPAEVDTWANGDSYAVYSLPKISLAGWQNTLTDKNLITFVNNPTLYQLEVSELNGTVNTTDQTLIGQIYMIEASSTRYLMVQQSAFSLIPQFVNSDIGQGLVGGGGGETIEVFGGQWRNGAKGWPVNMAIDGDTIFAGMTSPGDAVPISFYGTICVDGAGANLIQVDSQFGPAFPFSRYNAGQPVIWGTGGIDVRGRWEYTGTAAATFLQTGGFQLLNSSSANSMSATGITTGIALTPAALDATAGATGFGGNAFNNLGAAITNLSAMTGFSIPTPVSATTYAAHGVVVGEGASLLGVTAAGASGLPLVGAGASADPSFAALNLAGAGVTGNLPIADIAPSSTNGQVLFTSGGVSTWGSLPAGASVSGSGWWHTTSGALDSAASHGTAGQFGLTNAAGSDITWATITGDTSCSTSTPGQCANLKVNGTSYPPGGALTTGNAPYVSSTTAVTYSALNLGGGSGWVSGQTPVVNGGTGVASIAAHALVCGEGTSPVVAIAPSSTGGLPLVSNGSFADPSFQVINLSGGPFTGALPTNQGGTGLVSVTAHDVMIGAGSSPVSVAAPGAAGQYLRSNGASSDPSFQGGVTATTLTYCASGCSGVSGSTFICPPIGQYTARGAGGGGGGGGGANGLSGTASTYAGGGGAGGGSIASTEVVLCSPGATETTTLGAGGAGGGGGGSGGGATFITDSVFGVVARWEPASGGTVGTTFISGSPFIVFALGGAGVGSGGGAEYINSAFFPSGIAQGGTGGAAANSAAIVAGITTLAATAGNDNVFYGKSSLFGFTTVSGGSGGTQGLAAGSVFGGAGGGGGGGGSFGGVGGGGGSGGNASSGTCAGGSCTGGNASSCTGYGSGGGGGGGGGSGVSGFGTPGSGSSGCPGAILISYLNQ